MALGETQGALAAARQAQQIFQALAAQQPNSVDFQRELSVSDFEVGDVQKAQGDLAAALASYQARPAISERLAKSDPGNAELQRDVALSQTRIGDVLVAQGHLPAALNAYQASLDIADRFAKSEPGNSGRQNDLAICTKRLATYKRRKAICRPRWNPTRRGLRYRTAWRSPIRQRRLAVRSSISHSRVGDVQVAQGNFRVR